MYRGGVNLAEGSVREPLLRRSDSTTVSWGAKDFFGKRQSGGRKQKGVGARNGIVNVLES